MNCWHCGAPLNLTGKILFRAECDACHAALHCCRNCVFYKPSMPNDCLIPNTDFIADRTTINFCEEFKPLGKPPEKKVNPKDVSKKLFGDEGEGKVEGEGEEKGDVEAEKDRMDTMNEKNEERDSKNRFDDLFK